MYAEVYLKANDYSKHIHRFFHIRVSQSLFKDWVIWVSYGRIGHKARERKYFYLEPTELIKKYKQLVNKRLKSENRIGCNYIKVEEAFDPIFASLITQKSKNVSLN